MTSYACDYCGEAQADEPRTIGSPLGDSVIWACSDECAEEERVKREGWWITWGPAKGSIPNRHVGETARDS